MKRLACYVSGAQWPAVSYFCTTRHGGVSTGEFDSFNMALHTGDDAGHVQQNRARLGRVLPAAPLWLEQVHGTAVFDADAHCQPPGACPVADAAITTTPGRVLAVMSADCLPVVIAESHGRVLGVAHAGWRGLADGILENTFRQMRTKVPAGNGWKAWVGPGISQARFDVGPDVLSAFTNKHKDSAAYFTPGHSPQTWRADLAGLAAHRLRLAGVDDIQLSDLCTYERADLFYSYRRHSPCGRLATVAWIGR